MIVKDIVQTVSVGILIALVGILIIAPYRITGDSMEPTLSSGQFVLVEKVSLRFRDPQVSEVIVFKAPVGGELIKRVIRKVDQNGYWVEGDNKLRSTDSREFGPITKQAIVGRVLIF